MTDCKQRREAVTIDMLQRNHGVQQVRRAIRCVPVPYAKAAFDISPARHPDTNHTARLERRRKFAECPQGIGDVLEDLFGIDEVEPQSVIAPFEILKLHARAYWRIVASEVIPNGRLSVRDAAKRR